jgi:hypothetical protein
MPQTVAGIWTGGDGPSEAEPPPKFILPKLFDAGLVAYARREVETNTGIFASASSCEPELSALANRALGAGFHGWESVCVRAWKSTRRR